MEEELVTRQHIPYTGIPAAGVHGVGLRALPGNLMRLARGTMASRRILREFRPDVVLFTGGYVAVPLAVMAMAVLAEFKGSRWMAILMSGDGEPYADEAPKPPARKRGKAAAQE